MEQYKKKVRRRIQLLAIPVLIAVGTGIFHVFFAEPEMQESFISGFQSGLITALGLISVVLMIRLGRLLKDEAKLKEAYRLENDERMKAIRAKAGMPLLLITSVAMIIAGVIAGYYNMLVFSTLIIAGIAQMSIGAVIKLVYTRKM